MSSGAGTVEHVFFPLGGSAWWALGKLSEMPEFLVATRLQNLCGEPHQLAKILTGREVDEVQISGTKSVF